MRKAEYLIVLPIESMPLHTGYEQGKSLPLHCTLMHWFSLDMRYSRARLWEEVQQVCAQHMYVTGCPGRIELVSEACDLFGPNNDVPVHTLRRNDVLLTLHTRLLMLLTLAYSWPPALHWVGAGYRPHVSTVEGRSFPPGTKHIATRLALVERTSDRVKRIIGRYSLQ